MDDIAADLYAKVATDRAGRGILGVRLTQHHATSFDNVQAFPDLKREFGGANVY